MTVDALAQSGAAVDLITPGSYATLLTGAAQHDEAVRKYYGVTRDFRIRLLYSLEPSRWEMERASHPVLSALKLRRSEYDVFYTRSRTSLLLAASMGWPVLFETYRLLGQDSPTLIKLFAQLARQDSVLGIITHSKASLESIASAGFPRHKLAAIHNGFDPRALQPPLTKSEARQRLGLPPDRPTVAYTGHVRRNKGIDAMLDVAALTSEVQYLIVGGLPDDLAELRANIAERRLRNVTLVGWVPATELSPFLYAADVLMIPPSAKPLQQFGRTVLPMKVFSYLAAGRPIIAPALTDLQEVLTDGQNARLVRPDDPAGTARALGEILSSSALSGALSVGALRSSEGLTWQARAVKILARIEQWRQP